MRGQAASIVPDDDAIGIEHRNNFENVAVSQSAGNGIGAYQELNEPFHDERAVAFSRMHPSRQDNAFPLRNVILRGFKIRNNQHF